MGMFDRIKNIFGAGVEKVVSGAEDKDPAGIIKHILKQEEERLIKFKDALKDLGAEKISLEKKVSELKTSIKKWEDNAKFALEEENEKLATQALEKQTEAEDELESTNKLLKSIASKYDKYVKQISEQSKLIETKKSELKVLEARQKSAQNTLEMQKSFDSIGESGLNQTDALKSKIDEMENKVTAAEELEEDLSGDNLEDEFEELEKRNEVSDKLAKLKAKMKK